MSNSHHSSLEELFEIDSSLEDIEVDAETLKALGLTENDI